MNAAYSCPRCGESTQLYSSEDGYWPIIATPSGGYEFGPFEPTDTRENYAICCTSCDWETSTTDPGDLSTTTKER